MDGFTIYKISTCIIPSTVSLPLMSKTTWSKGISKFQGTTSIKLF